MGGDDGNGSESGVSETIGVDVQGGTERSETFGRRRIEPGEERRGYLGGKQGRMQDRWIAGGV